MSDKWDLPKDVRKKGQKYPNYNLVRTVSGHVVQYDDTKGAESVTIQHRSGSLYQLQADGSVVFRSEKNNYQAVFGDKKIMVTGLYDITVNGGASMKVEGDYDMTVNGSMKTAVKGNWDIIVNGNHNTLVKGNKDSAIDGSETVKVKGNYEHTSEGKTYVGSHTGLKVESTGDMVNIVAATKLSTKSTGVTEIVAEGQLNQQGSKVSVSGKTYIGQNGLGETNDAVKIMTEAGPTTRSFTPKD